MLRRIVTRVGDLVDTMDVGSRRIAAARSLIAVAQLTILVFTRTDALFVPVENEESGPTCEGPSSFGVYCVGSEAISTELSSVLLGLIFVSAIVGFLPRYVGILHAWATMSLSSSINLPDGGEVAANGVVALLMFVSLSDSRLNHWHVVEERRSSIFAPLSWGAWQLLRIQVVWIYLNAAIAKTSVTDWAEGSAIYYVVRDPLFGTAGPLQSLARSATEVPIIALGLAWGTIVAELAIAFFLLQTGRKRLVALVLAVLLHVSFIIVIGLWSFALVMIGAVLAATGPVYRRAMTPEENRSSLQAVMRESK